MFDVLACPILFPFPNLSLSVKWHGDNDYLLYFFYNISIYWISK